MKIAIDYDNTYTADPAFWDDFIAMCRRNKHDVVIVTASPERDDIEAVANRLCAVAFFTDGVQKESRCRQIGWIPDIWIDDDPVSIPSVDLLEKQAAGCRKWGE